MAFDALGYKLITGISLWTCTGVANNANASLLQQQNPTLAASINHIHNRRDDSDNPGTDHQLDTPGASQDTIVNSYQNLVQRYDSLVRNYQRLFMVRHQLVGRPPPPNTVVTSIFTYNIIS